MIKKFARTSIIASVIIFWSALLMFAALYPDYYHYTKAISELGAFGAPHSFAWNLAGFIVPGLLLAVGGAGIAFAIDGQRSILFWLLVVSGLGFAGTGVLPAEMHHGFPLMQSSWTLGHVLMMFVSGIPWVIAAFVLVSHVRRHSRWRGFTPLAIFLSIVALASLIFNIVGRAMPFFMDKPGLIQRIAFAVYFGWFLAVGLVFLTATSRVRP